MEAVRMVFLLESDFRQQDENENGMEKKKKQLEEREIEKRERKETEKKWIDSKREKQKEK